MMEKERKYVSDILLAISLIEQFTEEVYNFDSYCQDIKTQSAVERQLAIVGEALNKLKQINPDISIINDKQIISLRNRLVHAYDSIDSTIIWTILKNHLPQLKKEVQLLDIK